MATADAGDGEIGGETVIEVNDSSAEDEISPLLDRSNPKMTIFSVSYSRKRTPNKDNLLESSVRAGDTEVDVLYQIVSWVWSGSRYSGMLCAASASAIYFVMEILAVGHSVSLCMEAFEKLLQMLSHHIILRSVPLFQTLFTRCTVILLFSFLWLRRTGQPISVPTHVRNLLILRSLTGLISVLSFIYSVQNLPLSLAITLNFATPIMASVGAMIILQEKLAVPYNGGIACSFFGLMLIFLPTLKSRGDLIGTGNMSIPTSVQGSHPIFAILVGIFSSTLGGISYSLTQAGAKASDHPVYTVFWFGLLATPVSAVCTFTFQEFVLPSAFTFFLMIVLSLLAFFAEICLARGLQIEKVSKVTNILYMKVLLSQVWSLMFLGAAASFSGLIGCLLILASICSTVYLGPEKETE